MSGVAEITKILRSDECAQIDFTFRCISISGADLRNIANLVEAGTIRLVRSAYLPSAWMVYSFEYDAIIMGQAPEANNVVHECVHAVNDFRVTRIPVVDDEAVAYIAQSIYLKLAQPKYRSERIVKILAEKNPNLVTTCTTSQDS